jgi:hypothetical protein
MPARPLNVDTAGLTVGGFISTKTKDIADGMSSTLMIGEKHITRLRWGGSRHSGLNDGTPLARGIVFLTGNGTDGARGQIQPDGTFRLGTFTPTDGAKPNAYTAYVLGATEEDTRSYEETLNLSIPGPLSLVHRNYEAAATSHVRVEINPPEDAPRTGVRAKHSRR